MAERYRHLPLGGEHLALRASFTCGVEELDRYLRERARREMDQRVAAVWILHDSEENRIAGFYTLSAVAIERSALPPEFTQRLARYETYPATLLGRLALDQGYQGRRLGGRLLLDALLRALVTSRQIASVAIVTDAKDDRAQSFYERYGFRPLSFRQDRRRLFLPMKAVEDLVSEPPASTA